MRMSRSRLSVGTDAREWLAAQRANGTVPPPVPPVPSKIETGAPPVTEVQTQLSAGTVQSPPTVSPVQEKPEEAAELPPVSSIPAPEQPPVPEFVPPPPPVPQQPPIVVAAAPEPVRPSFKEPPPELDDLPPRPPAFREPDLGDVSPPPPRPTFAEPKESIDDVDLKSPSSATFVSPSETPRSSSPKSPAVRVRTPLSAASPTARKFTSRSPSPPPSATEDRPIAGAGNRASLSRHPLGEASRVRGPRGSRPPRTGGGSSVSNMVANLNRNSLAGSPTSPSARPTSPPGSATSGGFKGRPASTLIEDRRRSLNRVGGTNGSRPGSLSRRTMESDAEDNIIN